MKISRYAVDNPQLTLLLFLMAVVIGVYTVITMPRAEDPEVLSPAFPIVAIYPGASPKDIESLVVDPLEKRLMGLENIKEIRTEIRDGLAVFLVQYRYGSNVDEKHQELIREVNSIRRDLPQDLHSIEVQKLLPSNVNILQVAVVSDNASMDNIRSAAEDLKDQLARVPQLKNVEIHGLPRKLVRVGLKLGKMRSMHIPLEPVLAAIQSEGLNIPGGSIDAGAKTYNVKTSGSFGSINELRNTIVYSSHGRNLRLLDVAEVYQDFEEHQYTTRLNGHRCVFVVAALKSGENIAVVQGAYRAVLAGIAPTLPKNVAIVPFFEQADNVNRRLTGLSIDFLIAVALVGVTLLPLGLRAMLIVMVSIPLSIAIGIVLLDQFGFTLNQLSIVGLVLSLGLLVDDSIVVTENIERWIREGTTRREAALGATRQIGLAVLGCTATLIVAFIPLMLLPGGSGDFIRNLPAAVIASVLASALVSLTVIPFLASNLLKDGRVHREGNIFLRLLQKGIHSTYAVVLQKALVHPRKTLALTATTFLGAILLLPVVGFSLFPASEKPQFTVDITAPRQSSITYTDGVARALEAELLRHPEVMHVASNVGKGNPQVYYNVLQKNESADFAQLFVMLQPKTSPSEKLALIEELRRRWSPYPGAEVRVKNFEQGAIMAAPVEVRLFGDNLDTLRSLSLQVERLLKNTGGTLYVENPLANQKSDLSLSINKEKAHALGVPTVAVARTVRLSLAGIVAGRLIDDKGEASDIIVSTAKPGTPDLTTFDDLYVNSLTGTPVPVSQISSLRLSASPMSINHRGKSRVVSVNAFVQQGYLNDDVNTRVRTHMDRMPLPVGYRYAMGGEVESRQNSFAGFGTVIIATVFLLVVVLILEFRTFKSTLIVLSVIPLGLVGAILALLVTANSLSFVAVIGLVALAGIEVKNTILLVDFTNQLRNKGLPLDEAIRQAGEVRFLPIVLTSMTAIGGMMPIALSTNPLIAPLAIVIIGGLISSTLLSRIVTPVVYKLIPPAVQSSVTGTPPGPPRGASANLT